MVLGKLDSHFKKNETGILTDTLKCPPFAYFVYSLLNCFAPRSSKSCLLPDHLSITSAVRTCQNNQSKQIHSPLSNSSSVESPCFIFSITLTYCHKSSFSIIFNYCLLSLIHWNVSSVSTEILSVTLVHRTLPGT